MKTEAKKITAVVTTAAGMLVTANELTANPSNCAAVEANYGYAMYVCSVNWDAAQNTADWTYSSCSTACGTLTCQDACYSTYMDQSSEAQDRYDQCASDALSAYWDGMDEYNCC